MVERRIILECDIRANDEEKKIEGYAAKFNTKSVEMWGFREIIAPSAFTRTLQESKDIKALWNHDTNMVIGSTRGGSLQLSEDETGLKFVLDTGNTTWGKDAYEAIRRQDVSGVSFGFRVKKQTWDESDPNNVIRTIEDVDLFEISPTPFPAYPDTEVQVRSAYDEYKGMLTNKKANPDGDKSVEIKKYLRELRKKINSW